MEKRYNRMGVVSSKEVDKIEKSGIIREKSKHSVTIITDDAIESVPRIVIPGFSDEQNEFIQAQHRELLEFARTNNKSNEVAFVFRKGFGERIEFYGIEDEIDFGSGLFGKGDKLFVMHNHPRNSSFSDRDMRFFITDNNIQALSIVKNNGSVEVIFKTEIFDADKMKAIYGRAFKKHVIKGTDKEIDEAIAYMLKKNGGIIKWIKSPN